MNSYENKVVVITGGASGIGKCMAAQFTQAGATVCIIDVQDNPYFVGDLAIAADVHAFASKVIADFGHVDVLVNNAKPATHGVTEGSYAQFMQALQVGVGAPFLLAQLFAPHFAPQACILNISSSRAKMSQPQTESYTAAKGGIAALTHALAASFAGKVRANAISPGWIDTNDEIYTGADATQHTAGRVGNPMDIAQMALFLCSPQAGFINGEDICIDGGMTHTMIYHGDGGWSLQP